MKIFLNKKSIEQVNTILPERLKLTGHETDIDFKKKLVNEVLKKKKESVSGEDLTKLKLAKTFMKNTEENLEFIDEIKTNIVINSYLKQNITQFQGKLLPLAYVNSTAKRIESGKFEEKFGVEGNILDVLKRFKEREIDPDECKEKKRIRKFILRNTEFLLDRGGD